MCWVDVFAPPHPTRPTVWRGHIIWIKNKLCRYKISPIASYIYQDRVAAFPLGHNPPNTKWICADRLIKIDNPVIIMLSQILTLTMIIKMKMKTDHEEEVCNQYNKCMLIWNEISHWKFRRLSPGPMLRALSFGTAVKTLFRVFWSLTDLSLWALCRVFLGSRATSWGFPSIYIPTSLVIFGVIPEVTAVQTQTLEANHNKLKTLTNKYLIPSYAVFWLQRINLLNLNVHYCTIFSKPKGSSDFPYLAQCIQVCFE